MELDEVIDTVARNPGLIVIAVIALALLYYLANRKPKSVRDAEERMNRLKKEKADHYRHPRPPG